ncbi:MAG: hypothetical protein IAF01_03470, partial [Xanthomonadaceae bacterium]|nr:hypothetical protein [Xanthomonadaceae bacterium]
MRVPEVTFATLGVANPRHLAQHGAMRRMPEFLKTLLQPLPLAGLLTILTVGYSLRFVEAS